MLKYNNPICNQCGKDLDEDNSIDDVTCDDCHASIDFDFIKVETELWNN